jgi:hypothetical protein
MNRELERNRRRRANNRARAKAVAVLAETRPAPWRRLKVPYVIGPAEPVGLFDARLDVLLP